MDQQPEDTVRTNVNVPNLSDVNNVIITDINDGQNYGSKTQVVINFNKVELLLSAMKM